MTEEAPNEKSPTTAKPASEVEARRADEKGKPQEEGKKEEQHGGPSTTGEKEKESAEEEKTTDSSSVAAAPEGTSTATLAGFSTLHSEAETRFAELFKLLNEDQLDEHRSELQDAAKKALTLCHRLAELCSERREAQLAALSTDNKAQKETTEANPVPPKPHEKKAERLDKAGEKEEKGKEGQREEEVNQSKEETTVAERRLSKTPADVKALIVQALKDRDNFQQFVETNDNLKQWLTSHPGEVVLDPKLDLEGLPTKKLWAPEPDDGQELFDSWKAAEAEDSNLKAWSKSSKAAEAWAKKCKKQWEAGVLAAIAAFTVKQNQWLLEMKEGTYDSKTKEWEWAGVPRVNEMLLHSLEARGAIDVYRGYLSNIYDHRSLEIRGDGEDPYDTHKCEVEAEGVIYYSTENVFQAYKADRYLKMMGTRSAEALEKLNDNTKAAEEKYIGKLREKREDTEGLQLLLDDAEPSKGVNWKAWSLLMPKKSKGLAPPFDPNIDKGASLLMYLLVRAKFLGKNSFARALLFTYPRVVIEGNLWGDDGWGIDFTDAGALAARHFNEDLRKQLGKGKGFNKHGLHLAHVREEVGAIWTKHDWFKAWLEEPQCRRNTAMRVDLDYCDTHSFEQAMNDRALPEPL